MLKMKTSPSRTDATFKQVFKTTSRGALRFGFLIGLLSWAISPPAYGAIETIPLLRSASVSAVEAEGFAEAMQRQLISKALDQSPDEQIDRLGSLLQRAQENWISGSIEAAHQIFDQISDLALKEDWREPERQTIAYAILRLAQLAKNDFERDQFLQRAIVFTADAQIDEELFPPPLVQRLQEMKNSLAEKKGVNGFKIRLKTIFKSADFVRINGKWYSLESDSELILRPGEYRISVFSNFALPLNAVMSADELFHYNYRPRLLADGTCTDPTLAVAATSVKIDVLYANGCVRTWDKNRWLPRIADTSATTMKDSPKSDSSQISSTPGNGRIPSEWLPHPEEGSAWPQAPQEKAFWEKKETWIWVGVSALVAGTVYAIYQNQHPAKTHIQPNSAEIN